MSRSVAWRRQVSDAASWHQDEALNATIYILRETGPTGFLLKEEGDNKKHKVFLGDPHRCTCSTFNKEKDLCKHICWVLLKKFRVPRQNPVTWQLGLVEREINEILRGVAARQEAKPSAAARRLSKATSGGDDENEDESGEGEGIKQRPIGDDDVCPICQEEFFAKHLPVTYCKFGCGNSIHIKCMKVWADHQKTQGETTIKCPLCREDFGPFSLLQQEMRNSSTRGTRAERLGQHLGATCGQCRVSPIVGKCYKCIVCTEYMLCQNCFGTPVHGNHSFEFREKPSQRWRPAQRGNGSVLPPAVISAMMARDLGDDDYDALLQLDSQAAQAPSALSEQALRLLPIERVRKNGLLMAPGQQCRVCLHQYAEGQYVRKLPCKHKFHRDCIDNWLLHQHATCPVDGTVYTNESIRAYKEAQKVSQLQRQQQQHSQQNNSANQGDLLLEVPGIGIASRGGVLRSGRLARSAGRQQVGDVVRMEVSGMRYENLTIEGNNVSAANPPPARSAPHTSPLTPVAPSIPRPHDEVTLGIGDIRSPDLSGRPPSGTSGRRNTRLRVRPPAGNTQPRQHSSSQDRSAGLQRVPSNPNLYLGNDSADLLLTETSASRGSAGGSRDRARRNSVTQALNAQNDLLYLGSAPEEPQLERSSSGSRGTLRSRARDLPNQSAHVASIASPVGGRDLYIGSEVATTSPHSSPGRLRHGPTASCAPQEQLQTRTQADSTTTAQMYANQAENPVTGHGTLASGLYIGADPVSSEGCLRQFLLNSLSKKNLQKTKYKNKDARHSAATTAAEGDHRWGEVREMSGNSNNICLTGNRVQALDFNES